jgi:O-antigen/teichoic acid export membrane protein
MLSNLHGKNDPAAFRRLIRVNIGVSMAIVIVPAAAIMLLAPLAMGIFGTEYAEGSYTLVILAGSAVAVVLNTSLGQVLISRGAMGWRFGLDVLLAGVLALASWWLIPAWRDQGLALASLIAYSATTLALIPPVAWHLQKPEPRFDTQP